MGSTAGSYNPVFNDYKHQSDRPRSRIFPDLGTSGFLNGSEGYALVRSFESGWYLTVLSSYPQHPQDLLIPTTEKIFNLT